MLTEKQREVLDFILAYKAEHNIVPTLDEIAKNFDKSIPTIHSHVQALRNKGFIKLPGMRARSVDVVDKDEELVEVPLLGNICAGDGIENVENPEPIKVPSYLLSPIGTNYALKVKGDSMTNDDILDGDIVVVKEQEYADNGDVVVAIFRDDSGDTKATLKRFYNKGSYIELKPRNPEYKTIKVSRGDVEIKGKFMGLLRMS